MLRAASSIVVSLLGFTPVFANEDVACTSQQEAAGISMLQAKHQRKGDLQEECVLPEGAQWCEVRLQNLEPFTMAVYDYQGGHEDLVSFKICTEGFWEDNNPAGYGAPGQMMDIGGHVGYFSMFFAHAGWSVTTFEPMAPNRALINATLCRNPNLAAKVHVNAFGLGAKAQECTMFAGKRNVGNGHTRCDESPPEVTTGVHVQKMEDIIEIGRFQLRRLDEVLTEQAATIPAIDVIKIDVEGDQAQVFAGAPNLLTQYHPRLIKSEVWINLMAPGRMASGVEFLDMFERAGYKFFTDNKCTLPTDAKTELVQKGGLETLFICKL